jgi:putative ABC transport system substrate-binding protein
MFRIGFLTGSSLSSQLARNEAFRQGLRALGYVEGKNIVIEWRFYEGNLDRQRAFADELVRLKVEVIVTGGPGPTRAAKAATSTIPIVMTQDNDPVGDGFVASLARPGGNITGLTRLTRELSGKRLELLKEAVPGISRVGALVNASQTSDDFNWYKAPARALTLQLQLLELKPPTPDLEPYSKLRPARARTRSLRLAGPCSTVTRSGSWIWP